MFALNPSAAYLQLREVSSIAFPHQLNHNPPPLIVSQAIQTNLRTKKLVYIPEASTKRGNRRVKTRDSLESNEDEKIYDDEQYEEEREIESENEFSHRRGFGGKEEEKDFDKDPEFAEILGDYIDDPDKARSKVSSFYLEISFILNFSFPWGFSVYILSRYASLKMSLLLICICILLLEIISGGGEIEKKKEQNFAHESW